MQDHHLVPEGPVGINNGNVGDGEVGIGHVLGEIGRRPGAPGVGADGTISNGNAPLRLLGYAIFLVSSLLVLVADTAEAVIVLRALLGIGGAMIMPNTLSLIRVIFTDAAQRATALSIWAAVSGRNRARTRTGSRPRRARRPRRSRGGCRCGCRRPR